MTKLKTKIQSVLLSLTMVLYALSGMGLFQITAYADTTNADGSITKTATLYTPTTKTISCSGSWVKDWSNETVNKSYCDICRGYTTVTIVPAVCDTCGRQDSFVDVDRCPCKDIPTAPSGGHTPSSPHTLTVVVSPADCPSTDSCSLTYAHYADAAYGYHAANSASSSSTFVVWPITVVNKNNITSSISVAGCTATDAAIPGKKVSITPSGVAAGTKLKITNTGTGETKTVTFNSSAYTFTMPAAVTTVTLELATVNATTSANVTSLNKTYLDAAFNASSYFTTNSNGAKTYSSSDPTVATVSGSTVTIKKAGSCTITMNTAATDAYYASSASFTLNVAKATPTLSGISATAITYGQTLASSTVAGTAKVGSTTVNGRFSYKTPSTVPTVANSNTTAYAVTFTPNDTTNFNSADSTVKLTVNKAEGYITSVTATPLTYGQTLNASTITGQFSKNDMTGTFTWNTPTAKPDAGTRNYNWTFTPSDITNYAVQTGVASVTTGKATPTVSVTSIGAITYEQTLSNATVTGSASYGGVNVPGTFSWQNGTTTKPSVTDSNRTAYTLTFTPDDTTNYNPVSVQRTVTVNKAKPISNPSAIMLSATPITYGQTLGNSTITGTPASDVTGRYVFDDSAYAPAVAESGNSFAVTFIPTDTVNYNNITGLSCSIVVNKATPEITDPIKATVHASAITYGQSLADSTITGDVPITGSYTWANPDIEPSVSDSNVTLYDVVFNPTDAANYNTTTFKTTLTVNPATPIITEEMKRSISATDITYGDSLAASTLSGTTPIAGNYVWTDNTIRPAVADSDTTPYAVTFVPADSINYTTVTGLSTTVHVNKATPIITDDMILTISATAITYGETLADSTLSGDTPVAGSYAWVNPATAPTVADSNTTPYAVIFNPDDTANYNPVTGLSCKLTVIPATPVITDDIKNSVSATDITYGDTLAASTLTGNLPSLNGIAINGNYTWADDTIQPSVSDSDTTPYTVIFNPTDTVNFTTASLTTTLTVHPKTPVITDAMKQSISASAIVYEQTLADSTLTGDVPVAGHYSWDEPTTMPSVADSDITPYPLTFIPDDNINYTTVSGLSTTLTVTKLAPPITQDVIDTLTAEDITYGDTLNDSDISGDTPRPGHWEWNDPTITPAVSDSETTEYVIKFVPDDTDNYDPSYTTLKIKVNRCTPSITTDMISASDITYGQSLNDSVITGALPKLNGTDIAGSYEWEDSTIHPDAGEPEYNVIFTPDDTANFTSATIAIKVKVHPATPIFTDDILQSIHASDIIYEQTLADSTLTGDTPVPGHYEWKVPSTKPIVADSNATAFPVVFIPDSSNYTTVDLSTTLIIHKKAIVFSVADLNNIHAEDLTYGQTLGESAITGPQPIPGTYHWCDESIMPTVDGDNNYPAKFIPNDTDNYEIVPVGDVHVTVHKATPVMTDIQLANLVSTPIIYGQTLADSSVYGDASVPGAFTWTDKTIKPSVADSERTPYDVTFTPTDTVNYNNLNVKTTIKVHKAIPVMPVDVDTKLRASAIKYGQSLEASTISYVGSGIIPGGFSWADPTFKPEMSDSDTTDFPVVFTPTDTVNYENLAYTAKVHVDKATAPYENLADTISVKLGDTITYDLNRVIHNITDWNIKSYNVIDKDSILSDEPLVNNQSVVFTTKNNTALYGKVATITFTIESRDYIDFEFTLAINASDCKHNGTTHKEGHYRATCYSEGYTGDKVCDICGGTVEYGDIIPMRPHSPETDNYVPATCYSTGFSGDTHCSVCHKFLEYGHEIEKLPHTEGKPVIDIPATETTTGIQSYYCTVCGAYIRSEMIPMIGVHKHEWSDTYCFDEDYHWRECTAKDAITTKENHIWDDGEWVTATCGHEGTVKYSCTVCDATYTDTIAPEHNLSDWKHTETNHWRECLSCGEKIDEHNHVYGEWSDITDSENSIIIIGRTRTCVICDYNDTEMFDMSDKNPNKDDDVTDPDDDTPDTGDDTPADDPAIIIIPDDDKDDEDGDDDDNEHENPDTGAKDSLTPFALFAALASGIMALTKKRKKS